MSEIIREQITPIWAMTIFSKYGFVEVIKDDSNWDKKLYLVTMGEFNKYCDINGVELNPDELIPFVDNLYPAIYRDEDDSMIPLQWKLEQE